MMAAFVLDTMPVNAAFRRVLSNGIVSEHPKLKSEARFRMMNDPIFKDNLNNNKYVRGILQPEDVPFLQDIPGTYLSAGY